jgi:hypothetical protein
VNRTIKPALLMAYLLLVGSCGHASSRSVPGRGSAHELEVGHSHQRQREGTPRVHGACYEVEGELQLWNGWPPNVRLNVNGVMYGVGHGEGEDLPEAIMSRLTKDGGIKGTMRVCSLGDEIQVPYQEKPLPLVCIEALRRQSP